MQYCTATVAMPDDRLRYKARLCGMSLPVTKCQQLAWICLDPILVLDGCYLSNQNLRTSPDCCVPACAVAKVTVWVKDLKSLSRPTQHSTFNPPGLPLQWHQGRDWLHSLRIQPCRCRQSAFQGLTVSARQHKKVITGFSEFHNTGTHRENKAASKEKAIDFDGCRRCAVTHTTGIQTCGIPLQQMSRVIHSAKHECAQTSFVQAESLLTSISGASSNLQLPQCERTRVLFPDGSSWMTTA